jgi:uncharacterized membrane protein YeaQ/YmgE (transglycosylase-associated protein family)
VAAQAREWRDTAAESKEKPGQQFPVFPFGKEKMFMDIFVRILLGAVVGWLTGKAVEAEGRVKVVSEKHGLDAIYGIIGALLGEYLFFWTVIGKGDAFSNCATAVLGAITAVGVARLLGAKRR